MMSSGTSDGNNIDGQEWDGRGEGLAGDDTTEPHKDLFALLDYYPWVERLTPKDERQLNGNAVIEELQRNPNAAGIECPFLGNTAPAFPLHQAIKLGASLEVLDMLYKSYPQAIKAKSRQSDYTALHLASVWGSPLEVVSYLFDKWPNAIKKKDLNGNTPLHCACRYDDAPMDAVSLLLEKWPDAMKTSNNTGEVPLDLAKKYASKDVQSLVFYASQLSYGEPNNSILKGAWEFFCDAEWRFGIILTLDKYPIVAGTLAVGIDTKAIPNLICFVGNHCNLATMWNIFLNKQELIADMYPK